LFATPSLRRNLIGALLVSISITGGWWAVASFLPTFVSSLVKDPRDVAFYAGWAGTLYNVGPAASRSASWPKVGGGGPRPYSTLSAR